MTEPNEKFAPLYEVVMPLSVAVEDQQDATLTINSESPKVSRNVVSIGARTTKLMTTRWMT